MLNFLFRRLTNDEASGEVLFDSVTRAAREPHWYTKAMVPDTLDGRFAVLATVTAAVLVRLETEGDEGSAVSIALTERFIEVMETEHREIGIGDPALGRKIRKLVGSLSRRTDRFRSAAQGQTHWSEAAAACLFRTDVPTEALDHGARSLEKLWAGLAHVRLADIEAGRLQ